MENFVFYNPTKLIFGKDSLEKIAEEVLNLKVKKVMLLHYDGNFLNKTIVDITAWLEEKNIQVFDFGGVVQNPRLSLVKSGLEAVKANQIELIIALGGGSVIDTAKGIAGSYYYSGEIWDLYAENIAIERALPLIAIPTIPSSGSEVGGGSVLTNDETNEKKSFISPLIYPKVSIVDPTLFYSLPKKNIAIGIADATAHVLERYFTKSRHTEIIDSLCESTLRSLIHSAPRLLEDTGDYENWCQISYGTIMAHNDILGLGRKQNWDSHEIEHALSAIYDIPHGLGMAVILPAWMKYVYASHKEMFLEFAVNVMNVPLNSRNIDDICLEGIYRLQNFYVEVLGLPSNLREAGIQSKENFEKMAKVAVNFDKNPENTLGHIKPLNWQDILEIFELAY